ncbi:hypothetical protein HanHA300_Chr02g0052491 [Helianthus annuus]|nr:hypothetical protein HanHA300_Chr02g0052491 [Helianthus annuus]KAJ0777112.1 hypothetical protein HanLR1_Chr02g0053551 [Helianthus annuus]
MICLNPVFKPILPPIILLNAHQSRRLLSRSRLIFQIYCLSNCGWSSRCSKRVVKLGIHTVLTRFSMKMTEQRTRNVLWSGPNLKIVRVDQSCSNERSREINVLRAVQDDPNERSKMSLERSRNVHSSGPETVLLAVQLQIWSEPEPKLYE